MFPIGAWYECAEMVSTMNIVAAASRIPCAEIHAAGAPCALCNRGDNGVSDYSSAPLYYEARLRLAKEKLGC